MSCVCAAFVVGCIEPAQMTGPQPYPVQGRVTYRGQPAEGFRVVFHPLVEWDGPQFAPSALTNSEGTFQLRSYRESDGAPAGDYVVTFTWPQEVSGPDPDDAPLIVDRLQRKFSDPAKSRCRVTVEADENTLEPFVLE